MASTEDSTQLNPGTRQPLGRADIERYLRQVGYYLQADGLTGEILIVGGAYMTLVARQREATKDVDAYFATHPQAIREAAARVAREAGLPPDWLNDAVKGFLHGQPDTALWQEYPGLRVYAPDPAYIFALKSFAGRPEDVRDLETLRDLMGLTAAEEAIAIVLRFIPRPLLTPRVTYLLESLFDDAQDV